ncbi:hypothetical protein I5I35_25680 [Pseudomonas aeruginosa]|nr:hypothetical protein [Pseudomonas aeruginosa]
MQELNELKQELASLEAEHTTLGIRYAELSKAEDEAPKNWNFLGNPIGSPEFYETQKQRLEVGLEQGRAESRMAWLRNRIRYLEELAGADAAIAEAQASERVAAERVARIGESLSRVADQLGQMQAEEIQDAEQRQQAEQEAAQALAAATASGDSKALKAAQAKMEAAISAGRESRARQETNAPVISALDAEAEAQREQLAPAQAEQKKAAAAVNAAQRLKKGAEWDQAVAVLGEIGVGLVALGVDYELASLDVPTFAPGGSKVTRASLRQLMKQEAA